MTDIISKPETLQEMRSAGGKARAALLTPQRRKEISASGAAAKRARAGIPEATHTGELEIGENKIFCSVLNDGRRVITQTSMYLLLGKSKGGGKGRKPKAIVDLEKESGGQIPSFIAVSNLIPFMTNELKAGGNSVLFYHPTAGSTRGYPAEIIPHLCKAYLDAERAGVLTKDQIAIAERARIIQNSLATVGIISLIDEATGFQYDREAQELQRLFSMYIAKELQPWTSRFPPTFFKNLKKMYKLDLKSKKTPKFAGHFINKYIYKELSEEILEELKRINPSVDGKRKHCHHQYLTHDVGHPALDKQIVKINTLMSISDSKDDFETLFNKSNGVEQYTLI